MAVRIGCIAIILTLKQSERSLSGCGVFRFTSRTYTCNENEFMIFDVCLQAEGNHFQHPI
jgi:hypothetical protein